MATPLTLNQVEAPASPPASPPETVVPELVLAALDPEFVTPHGRTRIPSQDREIRVSQGDFGSAVVDLCEECGVSMGDEAAVSRVLGEHQQGLKLHKGRVIMNGRYVFPPLTQHLDRPDFRLRVAAVTNYRFVREVMVSLFCSWARDFSRAVFVTRYPEALQDLFRAECQKQNLIFKLAGA